MNWTFLITFGAGIGIYLVFILVFGAIKRHINKKKFEKEQKAKESDDEKEQEQPRNSDTQK